jgi:hypothetical protein
LSKIYHYHMDGSTPTRRVAAADTAATASAQTHQLDMASFRLAMRCAARPAVRPMARFAVPAMYAAQPPAIVLTLPVFECIRTRPPTRPVVRCPRRSCPFRWPACPAPWLAPGHPATDSRLA